MCNCGKKKAFPSANVAQQYNSVAPAAAQDIDFMTNDSNFLKVRFNRRLPTYVTTVVKGNSHYGYLNKGTELFIHKRDYDRFPEYFELLEEPIVEKPVVEEPDVIIETLVNENTDDVVDIIVEAVENDDLTKILYVGAATAAKLNKLGYNSFNDMLNITEEDWAEVSTKSYDEMYESILKLME